MKRVEIQAKHFRSANYKSCTSCAIALACREQFDSEDVMEGVNEVFISGKRYKHDEYSREMYEEDFDVATEQLFGSAVVRTIQLIEV